MKNNETIHFKWKSEKNEQLKKVNKRMLWLLGSLAFLLLFIAVVSHNQIFGFAVILASAIIYSIKKTEPELLTIEIGDKGVRVYTSFISYEKILNFWIEETVHDGDYLLIVSKRRKIYYTNVISITSDIENKKLRNYLLQFIKEKEIDSSFLNN